MGIAIDVADRIGVVCVDTGHRRPCVYISTCNKGINGGMEASHQSSGAELIDVTDCCAVVIVRVDVLFAD